MSEHPYMVQRRQLLEAISDAFRTDEEWDSHVVCGFALVIEFAGPDGRRCLATRSSDATGDADLASWTAEGIVTHALAEGMFDPADDDPDDED